MRLISQWLGVISLFAGASALAQNSTSTSQFIYNAYWSNSVGFQSKAELHNNSTLNALLVTPVLYDADGWSVQLDSIKLLPLANASIDVNAELAAKGWGNRTAGTVAFQYSAGHTGVLEAELYVSNVSKSLSFTIPSIEKAVASSAQHAVFWLSSGREEVYVALQNISGTAINVSPSLTMCGVTVALTQVQLPPHGSSVLELAKDTLPAAMAAMWQKDNVGGISVTQDGSAGALNTGGWAEDDNSGYSTTMTFQDPTVGRGRLLSTQILVGPAQSILNLDGPFVISSQLVLRNISDQPLDFHGELAFSNNGSLAKAAIPVTHMQAGEYSVLISIC